MASRQWIHVVTVNYKGRNYQIKLIKKKMKVKNKSKNYWKSLSKMKKNNNKSRRKKLILTDVRNNY